MSSVLPDPAPPLYDSVAAASGAAFRNGGGGGVLHGGRQRRAPLDRGVKRTTECPCAVRLYHLAGNNVAARSEYCSVVLGVPSVGINEAVATGTRPNSSGVVATSTTTPAVARVAAALKSGIPNTTAASALTSSVVARPIAVQLTWGDTTVWEVAHTALRAVRADVDAAYKDERRLLARQDKNNSISRLSEQRLSKNNNSNATAAEEDEEDEEALAPYSTPLHRYEVELLTGSVNSLGQASIIPLCTVACRQVLPGHPGLLPVRKNTSVDYNTALYELIYNLGDPVFVTCTRTL